MNELELIRSAARKALEPVIRISGWAASNPIETLIITGGWIVLFLIAG